MPLILQIPEAGPFEDLDKDASMVRVNASEINNGQDKDVSDVSMQLSEMSLQSPSPVSLLAPLQDAPTEAAQSKVQAPGCEMQVADVVKVAEELNPAAESPQEPTQKPAEELNLPTESPQEPPQKPAEELNPAAESPHEPPQKPAEELKPGAESPQEPPQKPAEELNPAAKSDQQPTRIRIDVGGNLNLPTEKTVLRRTDLRGLRDSQRGRGKGRGRGRRVIDDMEEDLPRVDGGEEGVMEDEEADPEAPAKSKRQQKPRAKAKAKARAKAKAKARAKAKATARAKSKTTARAKSKTTKANGQPKAVTADQSTEAKAPKRKAAPRKPAKPPAEPVQKRKREPATNQARGTSKAIRHEHRDEFKKHLA